MDYILLLGWLAACAVQDAQQRKIANSLTLGALLVALLVLVTTGSTLTGARPVEAGWAVVAAALLSLPGYLTRRMGAGDVKMLVALGAASDTLHLASSVIGAALAVALWNALKRILPGLARLFPLPPLAPKKPFAKHPPYAPFLCVGFALTAGWMLIK